MSAPASMLEMFSVESVLTDLSSVVKADVIREMVQCAVKGGRLPKTRVQQVVDAILAREERGSTGLGKSIAIPHAKLHELDRLYGLFARLAQPIDFDAIDDAPVDLLFLLLAPESAGADHLKALARVSRLLRDKAMCAKLRGADNPDALFALLIEPLPNHTAA